MPVFHIRLEAWKVAFVSQSTAVCSTILDWAKNKEIGFSYFVSVGDCLISTLMSYSTLSEMLKPRPSCCISIILKIFAALFLQRVPFGKPVIAIKTGKTSAGALAAEIHTGGKQSSDAVYDALFNERVC